MSCVESWGLVAAHWQLSGLQVAALHMQMLHRYEKNIYIYIHIHIFFAAALRLRLSGRATGGV